MINPIDLINSPPILLLQFWGIVAGIYLAWWMLPDAVREAKRDYHVWKDKRNI